MIQKLLGLVATVALPSLLAGQTPTIPNGHAVDRAKAMVALHSQGAQHRATHRRGEVVRPEHPDHDRNRVPGDRPDRERNPNAATPATPATPAVPSHGTGPATPAKPALPAVPANGRRPSNPGQSGSHRP